MAQAQGPWARAKPCAKDASSALMMKLISPCAWRVTFFERWRATTGNPRRSNSVRRPCGSGAAYSTNSKPSVPIGLSKSSVMAVLQSALLVTIATIIRLSPPAANPRHAEAGPIARELSAVSPLGTNESCKHRHRRGLPRALRPLHFRMARARRARKLSGSLRRRGCAAHRHGQGRGEPRGALVAEDGTPGAAHGARRPAPLRAAPHGGGTACACRGCPFRARLRALTAAAARARG